MYVQNSQLVFFKTRRQLSVSPESGETDVSEEHRETKARLATPLQSTTDRPRDRSSKKTESYCQLIGRQKWQKYLHFVWEQGEQSFIRDGCGAEAPVCHPGGQAGGKSTGEQITRKAWFFRNFQKSFFCVKCVKHSRLSAMKACWHVALLTLLIRRYLCSHTAACKSWWVKTTDI